MFSAAMQDIERRFRELVCGLDVHAADGSDLLVGFDHLDRIEKLAAAGKALLAAQIDTVGAWRGQGARDAVGFLADRSKTSRAQVRDGLAVAAAVDSAPLLDESFRAGQLTIGQAADIAAAVSEHPESEAELVELAPTVKPRALKDRCVEILAQGKGAEEQHDRAKAERSSSSSVGRDGIWRQSTRLPIIDGAFVDKVLDHFQTQIFEAARKAGERDSFDAYRADALVAMAEAAMSNSTVCRCHNGEADGANTGEGTDLHRPGRNSSLRHAIIVTVPHSAFGPLGLQPGETCRVPGVGPVPVAVVEQLLEGDPIIKAVVTRGRDITAVATLTRTIKEDLRMAVLSRNEFVCAVPGCINRRFLELDHEHHFAKGGATSYGNLRPLCSFHHRQRTIEGYELEGRPGSYRWVGPTSPALLDN